MAFRKEEEKKKIKEKQNWTKRYSKENNKLLLNVYPVMKRRAFCEINEYPNVCMCVCMYNFQ